MQISKRVLIIGLDGATWDVLGPWITDGSLPNLARLRQNGSWGKLLSSIPPITAAAWSNFMTGKRPGKHGVFHFINPFDGSGLLTTNTSEIINARSLKSSTLWDILSHHNRQVGLVNVPMTYPPRPVNGFMITGLLTPKNASIFTHPPELSGEITDYAIDLDRFIDKKPWQDAHDPEVVAPSLSLMQEFRDMLDKRARTTLSLMDSRPWDVFMVVFTGPDRMGHYLWPYHRSAEVNDRPGIQELCHAVHQYYMRLDEVVGELVARAGDDVAAIIMSDHGMGPLHTKHLHLNYWLLQHGWLSTQTSGSTLFNPDSWLKRLGLPRDKVGRILLRTLRLSSKSRFVKKAIDSPAATVDVERSKAYCIPLFHYVIGIRINLKGEEKETLREEITQALKQITDPQTGQHIVTGVYRGEESYNGPYADNIPEIIVIIDPDYVGGYRLSHYSSIVTESQGRTDGGNHRMEGIFIAGGPGIISRAEALPGLTIEDIAPTVLHLMGLPVPSDMDGRVLTEILSPAALEAQPIRQGEPIGFWPREDEVVFGDEIVSDEDEAHIRERLQALGYLE